MQTRLCLMVSCNPIYFCLQIDVLLRPRLFYKGECLKPDPLTPHWNTFTAPPRTRVPVKAPRPSMRCMLTLTIPKWLEDIVCGHSFWIWSIRTSNSSSPQKDTEEHVLPLIPDFRSQSGTAGFCSVSALSEELCMSLRMALLRCN